MMRDSVHSINYCHYELQQRQGSLDPVIVRHSLPFLLILIHD